MLNAKKKKKKSKKQTQSALTGSFQSRTLCTLQFSTTSGVKDQIH